MLEYARDATVPGAKTLSAAKTPRRFLGGTFSPDSVPPVGFQLPQL
jgi:hypothetical protein